MSPVFLLIFIDFFDKVQTLVNFGYVTLNLQGEEVRYGIDTRG